MDGFFDATQVAPQQSGGKHPVGNKWDFQIVNTSIQGTKDGGGGMFVVECASNVGSITMRYNIWNQSEQARKIAQGQLSALCHATGIFKIDWSNDGAALRGARFKGDVGFQAGHEPTAEKPEGGYVEMKKVYDMNGNEPGKPGNVAQQPTNQQQGGWSGQQSAQNQPVQPQQQQPQTQQGWNGGGQPGPANQSQPQWQQPQQNAQPQQSGQQGWTQQPGQTTAPWKNG